MTTGSLSISVVQSTSTCVSAVEQASTLPPFVFVLGKEVTWLDCGGYTTTCTATCCGLLCPNLQKQNKQAKDKGKVKPAYYGEALARNEMLDRIEGAEREKREWKAKKGGQNRGHSLQ